MRNLLPKTWKVYEQQGVSKRSNTHTSTALLRGAHILVFWSQLAFQQPSTVFRTKLRNNPVSIGTTKSHNATYTSILVERFDDKDER